MRKIERQMLAAIAAGAFFHLANTEVRWQEERFTVLLHGNEIANGEKAPDTIDGYRLSRSTLAGWDTVTTRSRLRALGVDVPALRRAEGYIKPRPKRPWHPSMAVDAYEI